MLRPSQASARRPTTTSSKRTHPKATRLVDPAPQQNSWYLASSSDTDDPMLRPAKAPARRPNAASATRPRPQATRLVAPTVAATSSDTDNDLRPAPASPLETTRSTANSYFTRLDADVDPDVMPIEIDEWFPPAAVPETPQQRAEPVALSSLPSPPIPTKRRPQKAKARCAAPVHSASAALPSSSSPPSVSPAPPPRRSVRAKAQTVQHWVMCDSCKCWRTLDAPWLRPTFECVDAGFQCETSCHACSAFPCIPSCEK